jgi:tRNA threonylcarbamoyladenosine modification (KEOPS) complex  Pcc1 subunit
MNNKNEARIIIESISPEIKKKISKTDINLYSSGKIIHLVIQTENISSLRAALNSYLRWISTAYTINNSI